MGYKILQNRKPHFHNEDRVAPVKSTNKVRIHWSIEGFDKGHGEPITLKEALSWIEKMNKKYGEGTHWHEPV